MAWDVTIIRGRPVSGVFPSTTQTFLQVPHRTSEEPGLKTFMHTRLTRKDIYAYIWTRLTRLNMHIFINRNVFVLCGYVKSYKSYSWHYTWDSNSPGLFTGLTILVWAEALRYLWERKRRLTVCDIHTYLTRYRYYRFDGNFCIFTHISFFGQFRGKRCISNAIAYNLTD